MSWEWRSTSPPEPAWDGPARWDAYNLIRDLPAMRQYDACFHCVSDGDNLYFGSSSHDSLFALDLESGNTLWRFVAGGPIRLAPTIDDDNVLFGCDDGCAYCLDRESGKLVWKCNPSLHANADQRRLINNDRLISFFPIRTGVSVRDGVAFFGASMLPWRESYICAVDAKTGKLNEAKKTYIHKHIDATLEGNLLVTVDRLIVPQGRVAPLMFDRATGKNLGSLPGGGGVTVLLTEQGEVVRTEGGGSARSGQVGVFKGKERVASFARGRSIVVTDEEYYVIDGTKLFAATRSNNELKWSREVDEPLELIKVGDSLFVGGRDHVTAVDSALGKILWSAPTDGRVFGLAFAGQRLIASTDAGTIHVFAANGRKVDSNLAPGQRAEVPELPTSSLVSRVRSKTLLHRWVFHRSAMWNADKSEVSSANVKNVIVKDQGSLAHLQLSGSAKIIQTDESKKLEAVELDDGSYFSISSSPSGEIPKNTITAEAWVRVDQTQAWGGFVGCFQDDGATEHGWLLGYQDNRFCFGLAAGGSGLTYLQANDSFKPGSWNHVVGSYNGQEMRLYVNGSLAASSTKESGPISYSPKCHFSVGTYRDSDENFPMIGAMHEVRIYSAPVSASVAKNLFSAKANQFKIPQTSMPNPKDKFVSWGPYVRYISPGEVEITYGTNTNMLTVLDLILDEEIKRFEGNGSTKDHRIIVDKLPFRRELQFQISNGSSSKSTKSKSFSLDSHFDWSLPVTAEPSLIVDRIIKEASNPRGILVVVGVEQDELAKQIARSSQYTVVLCVEDEVQSRRLRELWSNESDTRYGRKLCVLDLPLEQLPAAFAVAVVAKQDEKRLRRLVRPKGGILFDGNSVVWKRGDIEGSGEWTHMYGKMDNSAYGGEHLANASTREDLVTQWVGRPGPRYKTDRQNRKPSPLAVGGRLYLQGHQRMIGLDSYSGSVLWSVESPTVMRWNVPHDSGNWCADEKGAYVAAENHAWFIDGRNGKLARRYNLPGKSVGSSNRFWGFIGRYEKMLIGSIVDSSAVYTKWWGASQWFDSTGGNDTHVVAGDTLFALDVETGKLLWQHQGLVLHPSITVMDGQISFVQDETDGHVNSDQRRISLDQEQVHQLVSLDVSTGELLWRRSLPDFEGHLSSFYLAGGGDAENRSLISVASVANKKQFVVQSFHPENGEPVWTQRIGWEATHHGKHISRPAIQGDLVYIRPEVLSLSDGKSIHRGFPGGHGCSSYTASSNGIFSRLGETTWWDVRTKKVSRFKRIRTDCWVSVIPAQGMLLSAEGGGGCSCGTWMETSLGFLPRAVDKDLPTDE